MKTGEIHIKWVRYDREEITTQHCPTCGSEQKFLSQFENWYGWTETCLNCGDRWMDGERCPRPFAPRWRELSIAAAKARAVKLGLIQESEEKTEEEGKEK